MKRSNYILLLLFLLAQGGGILLFILSHQCILKPVVHYFGEKNATVQKFHFTIEKFNTIKIDEGEFMWNGDMYDIKELSVIGKDVHIMASKDDLETEILSFFQPEKDDTTNSTIPQLIKKLLSQVYINVETLRFKSLSMTHIRQVFISMSSFAQMVCFEMLKPPRINH